MIDEVQSFRDINVYVIKIKLQFIDGKRHGHPTTRGPNFSDGYELF